MGFSLVTLVLLAVCHFIYKHIMHGKIQFSMINGAMAAKACRAITCNATRKTTLVTVGST